MDVVIVGAGISGLTAARDLSAAGFRVRLLERGPTTGGVIGTERMGDFVLDRGPDSLYGTAALSLCHELGLDGDIVKPALPRTMFLWRSGALLKLPDVDGLGIPADWRGVATTPALSWSGKMRLALEPLVRTAPSASDESVAAFVRRRLGQDALTSLVEPLLTALNRGDTARLSMRALFPALVDAERRYGSVFLAARRRRAHGGGGAVSLRFGLGQLVKALESSLPQDVVATNTEVRGVERGDSFIVSLSDGTKLHARAVILATPAHVVTNIAQRLDAELARLAGSIRFASGVTVVLGYPRPAVRHPLDGWGHVVPASERRRILGATWVSSKWPGRAPAGHVLIRAALGGCRDPSLIDHADATILEWTHCDLRDALGTSGNPVVAAVFRGPQCMPQFNVGHARLMHAIEQRLRQLPGLFVSAAGFSGAGISHCIVDARAVARQAAEYLAAAPRDAARPAAHRPMLPA